MLEPSSPFKPLSIACPNFTREEVDALRSLLGLLRPYLKRPWAVATDGPADVYFLNLDLDPGELPERCPDTRVVGCARQPRLHRKGTLHRPLRVSEVLAVLSEMPAGAATRSSNRHEPHGVEWRYRLRAWPLEFDQWPREWCRILADITRQARPLAEIAARVDLAPSEVERCIGQLTRLDLLDRLAERRSPAGVAAAAPRGWRDLASRVGQILGFAR